jgi:hypothetical protein
MKRTVLLHALFVLVFPLVVVLIVKKPGALVGVYAVMPTPFIAYYAQALHPRSILQSAMFGAVFAGFLEVWFVLGFFIIPQMVLNDFRIKAGSVDWAIHGAVVFLLITVWLAARCHLRRRKNVAT